MEDNNEVILKMGYKVMEWNYLTQSNVKLWDFVRKVMNIWIPYKARNFWLCWQVLVSQYLFAAREIF